MMETTILMREVTMRLKKGKLAGRVIQLETPPVGLCLVDKSIFVACMDNCVHCFQFKGKKVYSLYFPEPVTIGKLKHISI